MQTSKKQGSENIRKITKVAKHSYAITLPIGIIREWGWKEKQKVELIIDDRKKEIKIRDWKKKK
ncbi:MAG: AbrB/MazE/SpoVT family DNA-binding domain-containing protein [Candidatus Falkowbacteria bacterium]